MSNPADTSKLWPLENPILYVKRGLPPISSSIGNRTNLPGSPTLSDFLDFRSQILSQDRLIPFWAANSLCVSPLS